MKLEIIINKLKERQKYLNAINEKSEGKTYNLLRDAQADEWGDARELDGRLSEITRVIDTLELVKDLGVEL